MRGLRTLTPSILVAIAPVGCAAWAQQGVVVQPAPTGRLQVLRAGQPVMAVELSTHGKEWTHAPQSRAQAQFTRLTDEPGLLYKGILEVPGAQGPLNFEEAIRPADNGFFVDYKMWFNQPTTLNGLQVSLLLPVNRFLGKQVIVVGPAQRETTVTLPMELDEAKWILHRGSANEIQVAPGTDVAFAVAAQTRTNVVIHDLRRWQQQVFEIRFWQVFQDPAAVVEANREFTLNLAFGFGEPVQIQGLAAG